MTLSVYIARAEGQNKKMSFHLRHSRNETAGFATVLVMVMISVISAMALTYSAGLIRKNEMQLIYNKEVRKTAILNSVISMELPYRDW